MTQAQTLIDAQAVSKSYGSKKAIQNVNLTIKPGEIVGLIGPNGAGKSTLLKAILGLIRYEGELSVLEQSPRQQRSQLLQSLSYISDVASLPDWISCKQLFDFMQGVHPKFNRSIAMKYLERTEVTLKHKVSSLSKGMKTQLHLALIMGIDSQLLVLDEPTLGLDVIFRSEFYQTLVNDFINQDRAILVTTHQVEEIEEHITRVMFINQGRISFDMPKEQIREHFYRLQVSSEKLAEAQALKPIHQRKSSDQHVLIFEDNNPDSLAALGELSTPNLAELFVAKVKETKA
jgi:ABC-2 type transport system ATP-binding protein